MDINMNLRAVNQSSTGNTSSSTSVAKKRSRSPKAKTTNSKSTGSLKLKDFTSTNRILKKIIPAASAVGVVVAVNKTLNTTNRIVGTITGNRFGEARRRDTIKGTLNPIGMMKQITTTYFQKTYETDRANQRIDYNRELAGMTMPYRNGNAGITL